MNLCTNAYHAMRDSGGTLSIELDNIEITPKNHSTSDSYMPGKYVKLEVRDTGHGMDKKAMEKIFNPYFTTKEIGKGTGMGLAVVDGIVKKHNGFIKVSSEIGHGSTFQVFWPAIEKDDSIKIPEKNNTELVKGSEQIMLVDDEPNLLDTSQAILKKLGYKAIVFNDAQSALQAFTQDPYLFDLVVTDMTMPQMTGDKLAIKMLEIRKDIPIILYTGYHESITENMIREIGISKYVQKPITGQKLSVLIREVLYKNKNRDA